MKKSNFVEGAFISTFGIVICKIIGILYVIPFRAIVGVEGAILYSYAYTIYVVFAALSSTGIPNAMAKTISEYNSLEYYNTQERAYKITRNIVIVLGIVLFLVLFIFAPQMAYLIIGDIEGGNSISDITFVIRCISTALLIIPALSVCKGYLQGHRVMTAPAVANVLEQLARVFLIVIGSFVSVKLFNLDITTTIGIAVFGATFGAIVAYIYILKKIRANKESLHQNNLITKEEKKIKNKDIAIKIIKYSLPFILIELIRSAYNTIDIFTAVKGLVDLGYTTNDAESAISVITTWGTKLNMIVLAVSAGLIASIIPNVVRNATLKQYKDVEKNILQAIKVILFVALPMALGIHFLSSSVWTIFYGYDALSVSVFSIYILQTITSAISYILLDTTNALNKSKSAIIILIVSLILKLVLNVPMMNLFSYIGIEAYFAPIITTMLVQVLSIIALFMILKKSYGIKYSKIINPGIKIILVNTVMMVSLMIVRLIIGEFEPNRLSSFLEVGIYALIGSVIYIYLSYKHNLFVLVFGQTNVDNFMKKIKKIKK